MSIETPTNWKQQAKILKLALYGIYFLIIGTLTLVFMLAGLSSTSPLTLCLILGIGVAVFTLLKKRLRPNWSGLRIASVSLFSVFIALIIIRVSHEATEAENNRRALDISTPTYSQPAPPSNPIDKLDYETSHQITGDNGRTHLYVLLKPVTPSKNEFQSDVKTITNILVSQCGAKTSIEFYDDSDTLELAYQYKTKNEPAPLKYHSKFAQHMIAAFDGQLENNIYPNTLTFFPATDTQESPKLASYIHTIEYIPAVDSSIASHTNESTEAPSPDTTTELTPEPAETTESHHAHMQDKLAYSKSAVDQLLKAMKQKGIVMELHPEVNSVYLNPSAWEVITYSEKKKMVTFFSAYCGYYCAVEGPYVHIKDGYSGKVLGETGFLGIHIKE